MTHFIVFCYIFTILIGVSALTIQWLAGKGDKEKTFAVMKPFIGMLLIMNVYDFLIYYSDNIIHFSGRDLMVSFGDCLIAVLVILWVRVETNITNTVYGERLNQAAKRFGIVYMAIWLIAIIFFPSIKWVRLIIDLPLIVLLVAASGFCLVKGRESGQSRMLQAYKAVITVFMVVNYLTYFVTESGIFEHSANVMNFTIIYWLVINVANMTLLYKRDFARSYLQEEAPAIDLDTAMEMVKEKFELTKREVEILREIYDGKTNTQIADELFISESTVKAHIYNLFRKMDVRSRVEAVCIVRDEKEGNQPKADASQNS